LARLNTALPASVVSAGAADCADAKDAETRTKANAAADVIAVNFI